MLFRSQARIIQAIRSRHEAGLRLDTVWREDNALAYAAIRYFGGWRQAVRAAGFPASESWDEQRVIQAIQARHQRGLRMTNVAEQDSRLASAALRCFGSWRMALVAAGVPIADTRRRYSAAELIELVQSRSRQGLHLARFWTQDRDVRAAVRKHFGTWTNVLKAAGMPLRAQRWNRERIVEAIRALGGRKADPALYSAARYYFGRWHLALAAAGVASAAPRRGPRLSTREAVLAEIRTRHARGVPLTMKKNRSLAKAAIRFFGRWSSALSEAGVPPVITRWSADRVLQELRQLDQQGAFDESSRIHDGRLANAASHYFGSKRRALIAAGVVAAQEVRRCWSKWTPRRIVEALQDRHIRGLPLGGDANLVSAAKRRFGSLYEALIAAGIQTEKPTPRQRWSRQRVVEEMRARHARGLKLATDADYRLTAAAQRYFGTWSRALAAAGLPSTRAPKARPRKRKA